MDWRASDEGVVDVARITRARYQLVKTLLEYGVSKRRIQRIADMSPPTVIKIAQDKLQLRRDTSPAEILRECAEIQRGWTDRVKAKRRVKPQ